MISPRKIFGCPNAITRYSRHHALPSSPSQRRESLYTKHPAALRRLFYFVLITAYLVLPSIRCLAHPISVTYTIGFVTRDEVTVNIEGFLEDLYLFHDLEVNEEDIIERKEIQRAIQLHKEFIVEKFTIRDGDGEPLDLKEIRLAAISQFGDGVHLADLMENEFIFELRYEPASPPQFLTFRQDFTDETDILPAEMLLQVKQENAGTPYTMSLMPGQPQTVRFDWENPALSSEASEEEWERWYQQQKKETLGITSYASVYSFLYIEDHEVRHEILIPLATLEKSISLERNEDQFLDISEQDAARGAIETFFLKGNPIEIDGTVVSGKVDRLNFYGVDFTDFARQAPQKRVPMSSARVGIILSYACPQPPQSVKLTWDRFSDFLRRVDLAVIAYEETSATSLGQIGESHEYEWKNPGRALPSLPAEVAVDLAPKPMLSLPLASLGSLLLGGIAWGLLKNSGTRRQRSAALIGSVLITIFAWPFLRWEVPNPFQNRTELTSKEAKTVFETLLRNVYDSFQFREESALYDALAKSIHGDLLSDVYVEIQQGLVMQEQGGAVSRVGDVEVIEGDRIALLEVSPNEKGDTGGFGYQCRWNVTGTVEHWGHIHERTNQYSAVFALIPVNGTWKITEFDIQNEERIQFETRLRSVTTPPAG